MEAKVAADLKVAITAFGGVVRKEWRQGETNCIVTSLPRVDRKFLDELPGYTEEAELPPVVSVEWVRQCIDQSEALPLNDFLVPH
jgi:hypothetical protein